MERDNDTVVPNARYIHRITHAIQLAKVFNDMALLFLTPKTEAERMI